MSARQVMTFMFPILICHPYFQTDVMVYNFKIIVIHIVLKCDTKSSHGCI